VSLKGDTLEEELEALLEAEPVGCLFEENCGVRVVESTIGNSVRSDNDANALPNDEPDETTANNLSTDQKETEFAKGDKSSRWMKDPQGELLLKWKADYAKKGGGGRAQCRDTDCLERHEQGGVRFIEKGCLRIGRRVVMPGRDGDEGQLTMMWYHARCIFNSFTRARKATRTIEHPDDIEDFHSLRLEDQQLLRRIIEGAEDLRNAKFGSGGGDVTTPPKRGGLFDDDTPASKRRRDKTLPPLKSGDRVWTFCKVRHAAMPDGPPGILPVGELTTRSKKPELAKVVEEPKDGFIIVQFESAEHEKERVARYTQKKFKNIRGWLKYPRIFEGMKQRVSVHWIQENRLPPRLCGCSKQEWAHQSSCTGISCTRGSSSRVWGVCQ